MENHKQNIHFIKKPIAHTMRYAADTLLVPARMKHAAACTWQQAVMGGEVRERS